jgi:O-antigen/teichoic acid export membrane protein
MHEKRVARAYFVELMTALVVYTVLLFAAIRYGRPMADGWLRTLVLVTPMIGFGMMIRTVARHVARVDEYQRIRLLENIAVAAAITLAATFTYGFMETAGFEKLSMFSVWILMGVSLAVVTLYRKAADR